MGRNISRREFFATAAGLAATAATARAQESALGANERFGVGVIGCGGQALTHMTTLLKNPHAKILSLCDIYKPRLNFARHFTKAEHTYTEYRRMLDRKDIDLVWIAVPDHWHSRMSMDAMEAGKDVYCEKPMTRYWHEAKKVYETARRTKRVLQVGSQGCAAPQWRVARDLIRQGKIGRLVWSQGGVARNCPDGDWGYPIDQRVGPHNLDWKAFLGPAPYRPYDPERFFRWRKFFDYSGGIATDLHVHVLHALCVALGNPWPTRGVSAGGVNIHLDRETPDTFHMLIEYEGGHSVFLGGSQANEQNPEMVIRGHKATLYFEHRSVVIRPEPSWGGDGKEQTYPYGSGRDAMMAHHLNLMECVRSRDPKTYSDVELGYKVMVAMDMGVRGWRFNKVYRFDPEKQELLEG